MCGRWLHMTGGGTRFKHSIVDTLTKSAFVNGRGGALEVFGGAIGCVMGKIVI